MAVSFDTAADLSGLWSTNTRTASFTVANNANRLILVYVCYGLASGTSGSSGVTYAGSALTLLSTRTDGKIIQETWYRLAPATGANNVVVTYAGTIGNVSEVGIQAVSLYGVNQSAPGLVFFESGTAGGSSGSSVTATQQDASAPSGSLALTFLGYVSTSATTAPNTPIGAGTSAIVAAMKTTSNIAVSGTWTASSYGAYAGANTTFGWTVDTSAHAYEFEILTVYPVGSTTQNLDTTTFSLTLESVAPQIQSNVGMTSFGVTMESATAAGQANLSTTQFGLTLEGANVDFGSVTRQRGGRKPPGKYDWGHRNK